MKVIFLGTSGGMPTKERGLPAIAIRKERELLLFDCGEGTQRQMFRFNLKIGKLSKIFITHLHGDHVLGVPGLIQTFSLLGRSKPLEIYGPPGLHGFLESILKTVKFTLTFDIKVHEVEKGVVVNSRNYYVECMPVDHGIYTLAYALIEKPRPGKFSPEKAESLGIPRGPLWKKLQLGEPVTLKNGRVIRPEQVIGKPRPGRKIVYSGDTRPCDEMVSFARKADLLIHDGTFSWSLREKALEGGHSTIVDAAKIALKAGVKKLVLFHISPRYTKDDIPKLEEEAKNIFSESIISYDFLTIDIPYSS